MANDEHNSTQRDSNLARIRDNQRRSRARRKDYLQELEVKYRNCEQTGVEASAEIQAAARKVVDENRRLRQLLKQQGLSDAEIDALPAVERPADPSNQNAASVLEDMLGAPKPCSSSSARSGSESARQSCTPSTPSVQTHHSDLRPQVPLQYASPGNLPVQHTSSRSLTGSTALTPDTAHLWPPEASATSLPGTDQTFETMYDYEFSYDENFGYPKDYNASPEYSRPAPQASHADSSSCHVAADAIRGINPSLGHELEEELGCGEGRDCNIPNARIFNIMDRYTDGSYPGIPS